jgi:hypothetical protein
MTAEGARPAALRSLQDFVAKHVATLQDFVTSLGLPGATAVLARGAAVRQRMLTMRVATEKSLSGPFWINGMALNLSYAEVRRSRPRSIVTDPPARPPVRAQELCNGAGTSDLVQVRSDCAARQCRPDAEVTRWARQYYRMRMEGLVPGGQCHYPDPAAARKSRLAAGTVGAAFAVEVDPPWCVLGA